MTFFNLSFPVELIRYINYYYFLCVSSIIEDRIYVYNVCICEKEECLDRWYKGKNKRKLIRKEWHQFHCSGEDCHTIINDANDFFKNKGFECFECKKNFCGICEKGTEWKNADIIHCKKCVSKEDLYIPFKLVLTTV